MILRNNLFILTIAIILSSCGGSKQVTSFEDAPTWVKEKPANTDYYIGIGSAIKTQNLSAYQSNAKNSALADISSEISVNISTNSVLHQMESSFGYSEDYRSSTRSTSKEQLQGYELMDSYENETHYWVYYKLSKTLYAELKAKKVKSATQSGLDYYKKAKAAKEINDYRNSIMFYLKGMESIKDYLSESLEVENNGKTILLGNEMLSELLTTFNDITISPEQNEIKTKSGNSAVAHQLSFTVSNLQQRPLSNLPVIFSIGNKPLRNNKSESDLNGKVLYSVQQLNYSNTTFYFNATLDIQTLINQAVVDPFFRQMFKKIDPPTAKTKIIIESPSFYVLSNEKNLDINLKAKLVENKAKQILSRNKYRVVETKEKADYTIEFNLNTTQSKQEGKMYYTKLNGSIKVLNADKQIIYLKPIENIQGVQLTYEKAGIEAYYSFNETLERTLAQKLKQSLK